MTGDERGQAFDVEPGHHLSHGIATAPTSGLRGSREGLTVGHGQQRLGASDLTGRCHLRAADLLELGSFVGREGTERVQLRANHRASPGRRDAKQILQLRSAADAMATPMTSDPLGYGVRRYQHCAAGGQGQEPQSLHLPLGVSPPMRTTPVVEIPRARATTRVGASAILNYGEVNGNQSISISAVRANPARPASRAAAAASAQCLGCSLCPAGGRSRVPGHRHLQLRRGR